MPTATSGNIDSNFKGKDILSLNQFDQKSLQTLFNVTVEMADIAKNAKPSDILKGNIVTLMFYEPSSRTFGSFGAAIKQLGGQTIDILDPVHFSSVAKGETLEDTIRVFEAYCDAIVIRHPEVGAAKRAAEAADFVPILNAGDGIGEHPTQALLDLYTIYEKFGRLDGLTGVLTGDILNGRTVHSLILGLSLYKNNTMYVLSPKELRLKASDLAFYKKRGIKLIEIDSEEEIPPDANFWYWTRVQKERFKDLSEYEKVKHRFVLTTDLIKKKGNDGMILMHPLPRVGEIELSVDKDKRAVYLRTEVRNGMYIRMALIAMILGKI
ncbi:MAG: aspartate carbamoyltransferase, partial [Candidatus Levybacteria bacterium]|nr:aspartate carbamoyltransferase [Candidatus Levybacteria bacterium]